MIVWGNKNVIHNYESGFKFHTFATMVALDRLIRIGTLESCGESDWLEGRSGIHIESLSSILTAQSQC